MEQAVIAIGSNLGDRLGMIKKAGEFLEVLSRDRLIKSSVWESEPVGGAKYTFYNAAAIITTELKPNELLQKLKEFEVECGREKNHPRWSPRILDLDIITYGDLVIETDNLIIPHPEFKKRLFVLLPMKEICDNRIDLSTDESLDIIIEKAPEIDIQKLNMKW